MSTFDWSSIVAAWPTLVQGLAFSVRVTFAACLGGIIFGTLIAVFRLSNTASLRMLAATYVTLMRSVPLILVIFWFFFLVPYAIGWIAGERRPLPIGAEFTAYIAFTLFEAAYFAEIVRAGLGAIPGGQHQAAEALGLSVAQTYRYILLPQALRAALPILFTQTIILFQDTSLVYVISATDLLGAASKFAQRDGRLVEMYVTVAIIYFVLCLLASQGARKLQTRLSTGVHV